ncbi:hypothetical protein CB1_000306034 [Camelus ferus]|nr:hypothetical protein CB1_000306034 [Camelus ferus]
MPRPCLTPEGTAQGQDKRASGPEHLQPLHSSPEVLTDLCCVCTCFHGPAQQCRSRSSNVRSLCVLSDVPVPKAQPTPGVPALRLGLPAQGAVVLVPRGPRTGARLALRGLAAESPAASVVAPSATSKRRSVKDRAQIQEARSLNMGHEYSSQEAHEQCGSFNNPGAVFLGSEAAALWCPTDFRESA